MMSSTAPPIETLARLRSAIGAVRGSASAVLPFGIEAVDTRLTGGGLVLGGLHETSSATPTLTAKLDE
ncbi:hypothetical protein [Sphingomonas yabuuchiae]|uniref:Uncharacterized protein n=1 Tax=Sphingomonas yabuuchiae TaxID=172044 RepID=A0AA40ZWQ6_9SPHN|nr:hypothetical protein [Sphingomonas yabuuchiae]MBN3557222.1 hypothetical protein [Sphingomonas yabuuchiae]